MNIGGGGGVKLEGRKGWGENRGREYSTYGEEGAGDKREEYSTFKFSKEAIH
jgi:hypothetical protein